MKTWLRTPVDCLCGACGRVLRRGDPVVELTYRYLGGTPLRKLRCPGCAGEAVPADLPPLAEPAVLITPTPKASTLRRRPLLAAVGELAGGLKTRGDFRRLVNFDPKRAAANDREPGEEG